MIKIGELYKRQGKNGEFLVGKFGEGVSIMIFPNKNKKAPRDCDYEMVIAEDKPRPERAGPHHRPNKPVITPRTPPSVIREPVNHAPVASNGWDQVPSGDPEVPEWLNDPNDPGF